MRSHLFFQIVSNFFQIGVFGGLRYHDFFKTISRFFQMKFQDFKTFAHGSLKLTPNSEANGVKR